MVFSFEGIHGCKVVIIVGEVGVMSEKKPIP